MTQVIFKDGKYQATINGKVVKRTKREHMDYVLRKAGMASTAVEASQPAKCEFSPLERYEFIRKFVHLTARGIINSTVITGSGGIGKTTAVCKALAELGLKEDTPDQPTGDFIVIRGFSTPRALYDTLYQYKDRIVVLDDADGIFKDPTAANIIKAALDDKKTRVISWGTSREDGDTPSRFNYDGQMIFVSNLSINQFPQAIVSRSQKVDLTLTVDEKVEVIESVFNQVEATDKVKSEVMDFVKRYAHEAKDLNIRSATQLLVLRNEFGADWERIAKYSFCG